MRIPAVGHYALGCCVTIAVLAACGGPQPLIGAPTSIRITSSGPAEVGRKGGIEPLEQGRQAFVTESMLHSFGSVGDGNTPEAALLDVNGTLYGTTALSDQHGTVFAITTSGKETVLHNFGGYPADGGWPMAGLINVKGTFYGTTSEGGSHCGSSRGCGTVFAITPSGKETVLHSFGSSPKDPGFPAGGLTNVNGTLYGTTEGSVFSITTGGTEKVLHIFKGYPEDGDLPTAGLVNVNGTLYGTTSDGGAHKQGTVFAITTAGDETVLHSFGSGAADGSIPFAGLTNVYGTLYGATYRGGLREGFQGGRGTVFAITRSGKETVLHRFAGGSGDGQWPYGRLINVNGMLYGTTYSGGAINNGNGGSGTVFSVTRSGTETVVYNFLGDPNDGAAPLAGLINVNGALYGTTSVGGENGLGSVFKIMP